MPEILTPRQQALPLKIDRQGSDVLAERAAAEVEALPPHLHLAQPAPEHQPLQPTFCATTAGSYAMTYPSVEQACAQNSRQLPADSQLLMLLLVSMVMQYGHAPRCWPGLMNLSELPSGCISI